MRVQLMEAEVELRNERHKIMGAGADNTYILKEAGRA